MKESQLKKVGKEVLNKYSEDADKVIAECAQKVQSSGVDEKAVSEFWSNKLASMKPAQRDIWEEALRNTENAKQAGVLGCVLDRNAPITQKKPKQEG